MKKLKIQFLYFSAQFGGLFILVSEVSRTPITPKDAPKRPIDACNYIRIIKRNTEEWVKFSLTRLWTLAGEYKYHVIPTLS